MSPTSTVSGCSIAYAMARAIASGGIAMRSRISRVRALARGSVMDSPKSVWTKPGDTEVTRRCSPASWRRPSQITRTAFFVPA